MSQFCSDTVKPRKISRKVDASSRILADDSNSSSAACWTDNVFNEHRDYCILMAIISWEMRNATRK